MELPVAPGMVAPLDGTPDDQGVGATPEGGKKNKSGGPRRKVGRWSEEETNTLILLTNQACQPLVPPSVALLKMRLLASLLYAYRCCLHMLRSLFR